jgi:hypothetical protein
MKSLKFKVQNEEINASACLHFSLCILHSELSRTSHAVAAVVAQVTVAVADGDGAAVIATGGVELETGELLLAGDDAGILVDVHRHPGPVQQRGILFHDAGFLSIAIGAAVFATGRRFGGSRFGRSRRFGGDCGALRSASADAIGGFLGWTLNPKP